MDARDDELIPLEDAARELGIEPKRLLGYCMDPRPWMPISDGRLVYRWSLAAIRARPTSSP